MPRSTAVKKQAAREAFTASGAPPNRSWLVVAPDERAPRLPARASAVPPLEPGALLVLLTAAEMLESCRR